jgi:hypothetical protein
MNPTRKANGPSLLELRIILLDVEPVVWRKVLVPGSITLPKLHRVLQIVMGWQDYHLHEFQFSAARYGVPDPDFPDNPLLWNEARVKLENALSASTSFNYLYDFGDGWEHRVEVERIPLADSQLRWPRCMAGENACPPEDVGGALGYAEFLRSMSNPANKSHGRMQEWCGGGFDPGALDLILINQNLVQVKLKL